MEDRGTVYETSFDQAERQAAYDEWWPSLPDDPMLDPNELMIEDPPICEEWDKIERTFFNDPITVAYGAQEMIDPLWAEHLKKCQKCREEEERYGYIAGAGR